MTKLNIKAEFKPRSIRIHPFDAILGFVLTVILFLSDVLQNKILDKGLDYRVGITPDITAKAVVLWYYTLFLVFIVMLLYMLKAVLKRERGEALDVIMGSIGVLSVGVMFGTTMFMSSVGYNFTIPFFNWTSSLITIYHFGGIAAMLIVSAYFSFTE